MSCVVGRRRGLDLALLWLWSRPVATVPIAPLAWEPPHASGVALKKKRQKKKNYTFATMVEIIFIHLYHHENRIFFHERSRCVISNDTTT